MSDEAIKAFNEYADQYDNYSDEWQDMTIDRHFLAGYKAGQAAREQGGEPDWAESRTLDSEAWKNPLLSKNDRLEIADGAVAWRNEVIANLRKQQGGEAVECRHFWSSHTHTKGLECVTCGIEKPDELENQGKAR